MSRPEAPPSPWPDDVTVTVESMAHGGTAVGRHESGRVVFVEGAVPVETVHARVSEGHDRFAHATLSALPAVPSKDRIARPRCDHYGIWPERGRMPGAFCGGCTWGHIDYPAQLRHKAAILADVLQRIGGVGVPPKPGVTGMENPWGYRNRIDVHTGPNGLGFVARDDTSIVPVKLCHIAHPALMDMLAAVDPALPPGSDVLLRVGASTGDRMVVLYGMDERLEDVEDIEVTVDASVALCRDDGRTDVVAGRRYLFERVAGHLYAIPPRSFFQVNTDMANELVRRVLDAVPEEADSIADVYSGVGLFAIALANRGHEVVAIESDEAAVQAALLNAEGLDAVTLLEADAAEGLAYLDRLPDVVVLDPPRAGLSREVVRLLADRRPRRIVYVSCEPATLARDAGQLLRYGWLLDSCHIVDMFPHTHHIESVNVFVR